MESVRARSKWKEALIVALVLALLALLLWLFLRPAQPARDVVFGDLGRKPTASNEVAGEPPGTTGSQAGAVSSNEPMATNISARNEPGSVQGNPNDQNSNRTATSPMATQPGQGTVMENSIPTSPTNTSAESSNLPPPSVASNQTTSETSPGNAPAAHAVVHVPHSRAVYEDFSSPQPEPTNKASTAALLAAARAAGGNPDYPNPARTADLLETHGAPSRVFDGESGSNVVFILDNSLSMMTNGKSFSARQAVARTVASMNPSQTFYVLLFHSGGYEGMPSLGPVPATPENVQAMTNWLFNAGHRAGADPTKAVQRALGLALAPDTVWLLSDSEIPDAVVDNIREANSSVNAHINTIGFYSRAGEQGLRRVAEENRGTYRYVPPPANGSGP